VKKRFGHISERRIKKMKARFISSKNLSVLLRDGTFLAQNRLMPNADLRRIANACHLASAPFVTQ
jgi:hypothetical protein